MLGVSVGVGVWVDIVRVAVGVHVTVLGVRVTLREAVETVCVPVAVGVRVLAVYGGQSYTRQIGSLKRGVDVVVGTPGRLLDLSDRGAIKLGKFQTLVLDEFDRMLDMGFIRDVNRILDGMKQRNHTMLFSATLDKSQQSMINNILKNHVTVKLAPGTVPAMESTRR